MKSSSYRTLGIVFIVLGMIGAVVFLVILLGAGVVLAIITLLSCLAIGFILIGLGDIIEALRGEYQNPPQTHSVNKHITFSDEPIRDNSMVSKPTSIKK